MLLPCEETRSKTYGGGTCQGKNLWRYLWKEKSIFFLASPNILAFSSKPLKLGKEVYSGLLDIPVLGQFLSYFDRVESIVSPTLYQAVYFNISTAIRGNFLTELPI